MDTRPFTLLLPLLLIPLTLYAVLAFGNDAGNLVIGSAFFITFVKFADQKERRFMLILTIFAIVFESINVLSGSYRYAGTSLPPLWIGMGWGLVGIYALKNAPLLKSIDNKDAYAHAVVLYVGSWALTGFGVSALVPVAFAVAAVYVVSMASKHPAALFVFAGFTGMLIEFSGTSAGVWQYLTPAGLPAPPSLASLGFSYCAVLAFGMWVSGVE